MYKILLSVVTLLCCTWNSVQGKQEEAQNDSVVMIKFGDFNQWITRNIKESSIIGGNLKTIYAIGPTETVNGRIPLNNHTSPWASSNVMARVSGIYKTNLSVYKEPRPNNGFCARLATHIEKVKVLGLINIKVLAAGSVYLGEMVEPITGASSPMRYLNCGIRYNKCPKALIFDYATTIVPGNRIRQNGLGGPKTVAGPDYADAMVILQKRWEDNEGNIYAKRVGTMMHRFTKTEPWRNNVRFPIHYGNITQKPYFKNYMALTSTFYARNSKGKMVPIHEIGWADPGETPTHLFVKFDSSHGGAYVGTVGNTLKIDNVKLAF